MINNLDLYRFYVGWYRYSGNNNLPWIACAIYSEGGADAENMAESFNNLDSDDTEASNALEFIENNAEFYMWAKTPSEAIRLVEQKVLQRLND
ncbi:hypothetical protein [Acinetobacter sp. CFCC 10889]|uniref:hypothetical protein n=1 Tax=Acinetobacter sp. CFCC 10889 TaxID=1775557 RepID=UPI000DD05C11|nr:hypothetical protein [Acinetobacter sp. CFCC 10889]